MRTGGAPAGRPRTRGGPLGGTALLVAALALGLTACRGPEAFLDTAGPAAEQIAGIWWVMFGLGLAVYLVVLFLVGVPVWRTWRRRQGPVDDERELTIERRFLWIGGIVGPAVVLFALYALAMPVLVAVSPERATPDEMVVEVVGYQFWWEVRYPDHGDLVTANEIVVPAGEPVRFRVTSADVIHSFWIPRLHGKVDMTPGHVTEIVIEADEPGHYRGRCTEYCGLAHAQMILHLFAEEPEDFEAWVAAQGEAAPDPETAAEERGREVFADACAACHTVRGHVPVSDVGPDLTHFWGRETLAAGILPLTREHLADWIVDPQQLKPGAPMPGTPLTDEELVDLLDYLESLR